MARFYGTIQGQRGEATRLGPRSLHVTAQSYSGDIVVNLYPGPNNKEEDWVDIFVRAHDGYIRVSLYEGPIADLLNMDKRDARLIGLGIEDFKRRFEQREKCNYDPCQWPDCRGTCPHPRAGDVKP